MRDIQVIKRGSEAVGEELTDKLRKTVRLEQEAPNASASSDPYVALEYPASGETQKSAGVRCLCRSQVTLMTTYTFLRWMQFYENDGREWRYIGEVLDAVSRRRCQSSQEK